MKVNDGEGTMDDYDWMVSGADWSHWSHHDNTAVITANILDINTEFIVPKLSSEKFAFSTYLGFKYEQFKWRSKGGSYIYTTSTFRDTVGSFPDNELAISYKQTYNTPYLGIGMRASLGKFDISGRLIGSTFANLKTEDDHHMRNLNVKNSMGEGKMYSFDVNSAYNFSNKLALELGYTYTDYQTNRDNSTYDYGNGTVVTVLDLGVADLETSMFKAALTYVF